MRKKKFINFLVGLILLSGTLFVFFTYSTNLYSLKVNHPTKIFISYFVKQGWAFFTRNPREKVLYSYYLDESAKSINEEIITNNDWKFLFGANRKSRRISADLGYLASQIPAKKWNTTNVKGYNSLLKVIQAAKNMIPYEVKISSRCGNINKGFHILLTRDVIPFSWLNIREKVDVEVKYCLVLAK